MSALEMDPQPAWPSGIPARSVDHLLLVLSDIEMGTGGPRDDFPQADWLGRLVLAYNRGRFADIPVTLVLNGDTFDFLKTPHDGAWPTHVDEAMALAKLEQVAGVHGAFLSALEAFLAHRGAERRVVLIAGNHDPEILFSGVQTRLRELCRARDEAQIVFPGLSWRCGDVHIEHGAQADPLFAMEAEAPFVEHGGRRLLNLPWGTVALLEVAMPLTPMLYHHDRLKPRDELLELIPELRDLLLGAFWRYWTREYWQRFFAEEDPLRRLSWTMLREVVYRFGAKAMDVSVGEDYQRLVEASSDIRLCLIGHQHEAAWWSRARKKVLRTGCFRNEFALLDRGRRQELLPKVYAEVYMQGGRAMRSHLVEVDAPPPPAGYVPDSIFDVVADLREALEWRHLSETVAEDRAAQEAQAANEARQSTELTAEAGPPAGSSLLRSLRRALERRGAAERATDGGTSDAG